MDETNATDSLTSGVTCLRDVSSVRPLLERWRHETNGVLLGVEIDIEHVVADVARLIDDPNADVLGLVRDGLIVGFMGVQAFKSPTGPQGVVNEHYLYVAPEYRGMGAVRLIKAAKSWAASRHCDRLLLNASYLASSQHDMACKLYERLGGKPFETTYIMEVT